MFAKRLIQKATQQLHLPHHSPQVLFISIQLFYIFYVIYQFHTYLTALPLTLIKILMLFRVFTCCFDDRKLNLYFICNFVAEML